MATDYEKYYKENRHGLGNPTKEFVDFFEAYTNKKANVLDVGCGQGRDSLFIARLGHSVIAVDQSPSGISDLTTDARTEGLNINAIVADVREFNWPASNDVIVIDRTLHMLDREDRMTTLKELLTTTKSGSHILIADEQSNLPDFWTIFERSGMNWLCTLERPGILFMQRAEA